MQLYNVTRRKACSDGQAGDKICIFQKERRHYVDKEEAEVYHEYDNWHYRRLGIVKKYPPTADKPDYQEQSLRRARTQLKDLIFFGVDRTTKFLTLTFAASCLDRDHVRRCIDRMCKRYVRKTGLHLPYLAVLEFHPGGHGYHVHMLVNSRYITQEEWQDHLWGQGIVDIRGLKRSASLDRAFKIASYLLKYLEKDAGNAPPGCRRFNKSKAWPDIPPAERLSFESYDSALDWLKALSASEGSVFRAYTTKLATGDEVTIQYSQRPLRHKDQTRV